MCAIVIIVFLLFCHFLFCSSCYAIPIVLLNCMQLFSDLYTAVSWFAYSSFMICIQQFLDLHTAVSWFVYSSFLICIQQFHDLYTAVSWFVCSSLLICMQIFHETFRLKANPFSQSGWSWHPLSLSLEFL